MKTKLIAAVVASKPIPRPAWLRFVGVVAFALAVSSASLFAQAKKPNILVVWGDDIGYWNISAYNQGMMGYKTPNIDRIAKEGALFTDWYGQQSCTAGTPAFITGQSGFRTGKLKVGLPGAKEGLQARDVTLAQLLKAQGYMTAQFGKNHLGDLDEHLPTAHGFDEFFGSLYHLNAEQEPENEDYFKDPAVRKKYGTRGVIHTWATRMARRRSRAPARSTSSAWRRSTRKSPSSRWIIWRKRRRPTSRSSCGGTRRGCTSGRTLKRRAKARPA